MRSGDKRAPAPSAIERIGGLGWAHFLNDGAANFLPGILPAMLLTLDLSVGLAGSFMAALLIGQGLQPIAGLLADRLGGRSLMIAGILGTSLGVVLIGFAHSVSALIVALFLIGLCNSLFHPQLLAGTRAIALRRQGTAMSVVLVGGEIGRGIWPAIASLIVVAAGREWLSILAVPGVITAFALLRWAPKLEPRTKATAIDWRTNAGPLGALVALCSLRALIIFTLVTFLPLIWIANGGSMTGGATLVAVFYVVGVVGNLGGGWLGDRIRTRTILIASMLAAVAATALIAVSTALMLWLVVAVGGVFIFSTLPVTVLIGQDVVPEARAFGSGLALGLANAIGAVGLFMISPLADVFGVQAPVWAACAAALAALGLACAMPLSRHEKRAAGSD